VLTVSSGSEEKKQLDRTHQGHAQELAAIQFIKAAVAVPKRIS
jgi:hypothetical protein